VHGKPNDFALTLEREGAILLQGMRSVRLLHVWLDGEQDGESTI
jgi:hypothetical protein